MKVIAHKLVPKEELFAKLRQTRLRGFDQPEVYKTSHITIEKRPIYWLAPCQNYVLSSTIQDIITLYKEFKKLGIDIFHLDGAVLFWLEGSDPDKDPPIPLLPPIVEYDDALNKWIINDGMHRIYAASGIGRTINVMLINGVPPEFPYYAYPLPGGWADVYSVDSVPEQRKAYRNPADYKALFRDFNAIFSGVQKKRT